MPEIITPYDEFKKFITEHSDDNWIEFGRGLIIVFGDKKINIRQYHNKGYWLSSWVDNKEFYSAINSNNKRSSNPKKIKGENNNE